MSGELSFTQALAQAHVYTIRLVRHSKWQPEVAHSFMARMAALDRTIFRIVAGHGQIHWQMIDIPATTPNSQLPKAAIQAAYPEAEVEVAPFARPPFADPFYRGVLLFKQSAEFIGPIQYPRDLKNYDPLVSLTNLMDSLLPGERIAYLLFVGKQNTDAYGEAERLLTHSDLKLFAFDLMAAALKTRSGMTKERYAPELQRIFYEKLGDALYNTFILVQIDATSVERFEHLVAGAEPTLWEFGGDYQTLVCYEAGDQLLAYVDDTAKHWTTSALGLIEKWATGKNQLHRQVMSIFNPGELASLWHLPHEGFGAANIAWVRTKQVPVPRELADNREGVCLGDNVYLGVSQPVVMRLADRFTHLAVFGRTGVGKTNFLHSLIRQDIADGRGLCVVDPTGNLVRDILRFSVPLEREHDVVVVDVANEAYPPPLNFIAIPDGSDLINAATNVTAILERVRGEAPGARWPDTLSMALLTLWAEDTPTIRDVNKVLGDPAYRDGLLAKTDNDVVLEYWDDFEGRSLSYQAELADPVKHRVRRFFGNRFLYPITCHPKTLDFVSLMRQRKIILVSLNMDWNKLPKEDQKLLGALVVFQTHIAAMSGACREQGFCLYVDEAEDFVSTSLPVMLTQARQFNLAVILANQYLKQLIGGTLEAVRGAVGSFVFFRLGDEDAPVAARSTKPNFESQDLMQMDKYQAVVSMGIQEKTLPAFSLSPRLAFSETGDEQELEAAMATEGRIRALSVDRYTPMHRDAVVAWLRSRYPRPERGAPSDLEGGDDPYSDPVG